MIKKFLWLIGILFLVNFVVAGDIGIDWIYPTSNLNVSQNGFFNMSVNVSCSNGDCGEVNVTLDPEPTVKFALTGHACRYPGDTQLDEIEAIYDDVVWNDMNDDTGAQPGDYPGDCASYFEYLDANDYDGIWAGDDWQGAYDVCDLSVCIDDGSLQDWVRAGHAFVGTYGSMDYPDNGPTDNKLGDLVGIVNTFDGASTSFTSPIYVTVTHDALNSTEGDTIPGSYSSTWSLTDAQVTNGTVIARETNSGGNPEVIIMDESGYRTAMVGTYFEYNTVSSTTYDAVHALALWAAGDTSTKGGTVSMTPGTTPFYTNGTNPYNLTLNNGESEVISWWVNATGVLDDYPFFVYVNETANLSNSNLTSVYNITILDTTYPTLNISYPLNTTYAMSIDDLNYSYYDFNEGYCWYSVDGGVTNSSAVAAGTNFSSMAGGGGNHIWNVYCNDSSGNLVMAVANFTSLIPTISLEVLYPDGDLNVTQNEFFEVRVNVSCDVNDCGEVNVTLDPWSVEGDFVEDESLDFDAMSAITLYDNKSFTYDIQDGCYISDGQSDVFDTGLQLQINGSAYTGARSTTEDSGREAVCSWQTKSLMNVSRKVYVPSDQNWARYLEILNNPTASEVCVDVKIYQNMGSDGSDFMNTSSGDSTWNASDYWMMWDDSSSTTGDDAAGFVYEKYGTSEPVDVFYPTTASGGANYWVWENVCVPAGGTKILMHYFTQWDTRLQSETEAEVIYGTYNDDTHTSGLSDDEKTQIVNWDIASAKGGTISMVEGTTPFYTNVTNPYNVTLNEGESQVISWWVNATGQDDSTYEFFVYANMTTNVDVTNITDTWNVTINAPGAALLIDYVSPTLENGSSTLNNSVEVNVSVVSTNLDSLTYNWNGTNFVYYNDSLLLMMNFDEYTLLNDTSSSGNDGEAANGAAYTALGKYGGAFDFDGINDEVSIPTTFGIGTVNFSIAGWVNLDSVSENGAFVKVGGTSPNYGYAIGVGGTTYDNVGNDLIILYEGIRWVDTNVNIGTGWHYVAMSVDSSGNPKAFIDGALVYQDSSGAGVAPQSGVTYIGGYTGSSAENRHADVTLDEVRIFDYALSSDEVYQQYVSNLKKVNSSNWEFYVNQSKNSTAVLDNGTYTYQVLVGNQDGDSNSTDLRTVTLGVTDTDHPQFSGYWDNNATLTDSGVGLFNVTVENTNGTVFLEINGTNVTATNLSFDVYNVSYDFIVNDSYSYKWHSWGNGTNSNYNASETRVYFIEGSCRNNIVNTSWGDWFNATGCLANDTILQVRNLTEYDAADCGNFTNVTHYEYGEGVCDYCTPSLTNASWTSWSDVGVCGVTDLLLQNRSLVQYDSNVCGEVNNVTFWESQNVSCNYCSYSVVNSSWSEWSNLSCLADDTMNQSRNLTEYDRNYGDCYALTGIASDLWNSGLNNTHYEYRNTLYCDYEEPVVSTLISPVDGYKIDRDDFFNVTFNCSSVILNESGNVSLYLTNASNESFVLNSSNVVLGRTNYSNWTLALGSGNYTWNCFVEDEFGNSTFDSANRSIEIGFIDSDSDGVRNSNDTLNGTELDVNSSGVAALNITVGGNVTNGTFDGVQEILIYDAENLMINFSHNFSLSNLSLNDVKIMKNSSYVLVNFSGQLQENKTMRIVDEGFSALCVKDADVGLIENMSSGCDGENETDFTTCLGSSTTVNMSSLNCTDFGSVIEISNLRHSAIRGTIPAPIVSSPSSSGGGGGGGSTTVECKLDRDCDEGYSCYAGECVKLFDVEILKVSASLETLEFKLDYLIKGMADINSDVVVKFWLEKDGEKVVDLGKDTIYLGSFETKNKTTNLNLPYDILNGGYDLFVESGYENYQAHSFRKVNVQIPGEVKEEARELIEKESGNNFWIWFLVGFLVLIILLLLVRRTRILIVSVILYLKKRILSGKMEVSFDDVVDEGEREEKAIENENFSGSKSVEEIIRNDYGKIDRLVHREDNSREKVKREINLLSLDKKKVFTTNGNYVGYVRRVVLSPFKVKGWVISPDKKYHRNKDIFVKHKFIDSIGHVFFISNAIEKYLFVHRRDSIGEELKRFGKKKLDEDRENAEDIVGDINSDKSENGNDFHNGNGDF